MKSECVRVKPDRFDPSRMGTGGPLPRTVPVRSGATAGTLRGSVAALGGTCFASLLLFTALQSGSTDRPDLAAGAKVPASTQLPASARRGDRPVTVSAPAPIRDRVIHAPTVTRDGDTRVVRRKPFGFASAPLAVAGATAEYDRFDALAIFSSSASDGAHPDTSSIYDADVESEVVLQKLPFDPSTPRHATGRSDRSALRAVLVARAALGEADRTFASLNEASSAAKGQKSSLGSAVAAIAAATDEPITRPASTTTLGYAPAGPDMNPLSLGARAAVDGAVPPSSARDYPGLEAAALSAALTLNAENVTRVEKTIPDAWAAPVSREVVLTLKTEEALRPALHGGLLSFGAGRAFADAMATRLEQAFGARADEPGEIVLRVSFQAPADDSPVDQRDVRRVSVSEAGRHVATLVRSDAGAIVDAPAPAALELDTAEKEQRRIALSRAMPSLYDGLMRAALSQGMRPSHAKRLVRMMAFDVDFRAKASPDDRLELFFSLEDGTDRPTEASRILYAAATIGGTTRRYYRYAYAKGDEQITDFFDETGRSAKKFLLRQPVPNGRFTSGYGMRRHPISRYRKMHTGVDWAARSGSPILSAGHGTVVKRGWAGGYGRQIKIQHANGYVTSYSHLRRFARGLKVGSKVRQGQRIGEVGSSGASTGPHLHYEVAVNGRRVNPMRIRLPKGDTLTGAPLARFQRERERIDALVERGRGNVEVAGG